MELFSVDVGAGLLAGVDVAPNDEERSVPEADVAPSCVKVALPRSVRTRCLGVVELACCERFFMMLVSVCAMQG